MFQIEPKAVSNAICESVKKIDKMRNQGSMTQIEHRAAENMADEIAHAIGNSLSEQLPGYFDWAQWKNDCGSK